MSAFKLKADGVLPTRPPGRRIEQGTEQQEALWAGLEGGQGHAISEARAGCGKSSSCREAMWRLLAGRPRASIVYAVFNSRNAKEFKEDCPPGVDVGTCHSLAYAQLRRAHGSHVEKNKSYIILDQLPAARNLPRYLRKSVALLVGHAKNQGLSPEQGDLGARLQRLLTHHDVHAYGKPDLVVGLSELVLARAAEWPEVVDFDDMVWLPGVRGTSFPGCDVLFLDEVQDWNPAQHALLAGLAGGGRVVAVGDRYQAIYAFRGADPESISRLQVSLSGDARGLAQFPLTVTFRCPRSHVALANQYVPDLRAHPSNPEGEVEHVGAFDRASGRFAPGDMVLCPANAPLVGAALKLIAARRRCVVRGRAIGDQLLSIVRGADGAKTIAELAREVDRWRSRELSRLSGLDGVDDVVEGVTDRAAGVHAVLSACSDVREVEPTISSLFTDDSPDGESVVFSTVHRAKGLEAHRVWLLEHPQRAFRSSWEEQQQHNLRYVALTRSRQFLAFVSP